MIVINHANPARVAGGRFFADRKFLLGMERYLTHLKAPLMSVHPELSPDHDSSIIDLLEVPEEKLGYKVLTLRYDGRGHLLPGERERLLEKTAGAKLFYGDIMGAHLAEERQVPYVAILEYNLKTMITFASEGIPGFLTRNWRSARAVRYYLTQMIPAIRKATLLHCNGYPVFEESALFNHRRLLYLDSRMDRDATIPLDALRARLRERPARPPRLLFSGRYEPAKGALDVVMVAVELAKRGVPYDLHLYGQGSQRPQMERAVAEHGLHDKVTIHDPVSYPELVEIARGFDLFVCCHVQDDPSCTYIESFGCGLPVVGYGNAMWRGLAASSDAGIVTPLRSPAMLAEKVAALLGDHDRLDSLSERARAFAVEHCFENEFARRTASLEQLYERAVGCAAAA